MASKPEDHVIHHSKAFESLEDKRKKRVEEQRAIEASREGGSSHGIGEFPIPDVVAASTDDSVPDPATEWNKTQLMDWNGKVKAFMKFKEEAYDLLESSELYFTSLNTMLSAEARVAASFLTMVHSVNNDRRYKSDAEMFQTTVLDSKEALSSQTLKDMEDDLTLMRESVTKWNRVEDEIITCDELRLELTHYSDKLEQLHSGKNRRMSIMSSTEKTLARNEDKKHHIIDEFNAHTVIVLKELEDFNPQVLLKHMLDIHLGRAEATHKMFATQLSQNFDQLEPRPVGTSVVPEEAEPSSAKSDGEIAAEALTVKKKSLGLIVSGGVKEKQKQMMAHKGPVKPTNDGFSAADANKHVKRGSAVSLAAKFEERTKKHAEYQNIVGGHANEQHKTELTTESSAHEGNHNGDS